MTKELQSTKSRKTKKIGSIRKKVVPIFVLNESTDKPDIPYERKDLPRNPKRTQGIWVRNSLRWADSFKVPSGPYNVPFIDKLGRFTGQSVYRWCCDPRQLVATTVSTVSHRIQVYARRHNSSEIVNKFSHHMMRASIYYCMSKNSWFWDRLLFFLRDLSKHGRRILTLVIRFISKVDDHKRFVYSQVSSQTDWLLFRARVPRDKSAFITGGGRKVMRNFSFSSPPADWRYGICEFAKAISLVSYRYV